MVGVTWLLTRNGRRAAASGGSTARCAVRGKGRVEVGGEAAADADAQVELERKTGLYVPNVETTRLVRDDRGWQTGGLTHLSESNTVLVPTTDLRRQSADRAAAVR